MCTWNWIGYELMVYRSLLLYEFVDDWLLNYSFKIMHLKPN